MFLCLSASFSGTAKSDYYCDDGETFGYLKGERSHFHVEAVVQIGKLQLRIATINEGFGPVNFIPITIHKFKEVEVENSVGIRKLRSRSFISNLFGASATFYSWR